jgi:hypothetical protein
MGNGFCHRYSAPAGALNLGGVIRLLNGARMVLSAAADKPVRGRHNRESAI